MSRGLRRRDCDSVMSSANCSHTRCASYILSFRSHITNSLPRICSRICYVTVHISTNNIETLRLAFALQCCSLTIWQPASLIVIIRRLKLILYVTLFYSPFLESHIIKKSNLATVMWKIKLRRCLWYDEVAIFHSESVQDRDLATMER